MRLLAIVELILFTITLWLFVVYVVFPKVFSRFGNRVMGSQPVPKKDPDVSSHPLIKALDEAQDIINARRASQTRKPVTRKSNTQKKSTK